MLRKIKRKQQKKGSAILLVTFTGAIFVIVSAGVLFSSVANTKTTRYAMAKTSMSLAADSGVQAGLGKIKSAYQGISLNSLKPEIYFEGTTRDSALNTTAAEKAVSGEQYDAAKNFYTFDIADNNRKMPVTYRIKDNGWVNTGSTGKTIKTYTIESLTKDSLASNWDGITSEVTVERSNLFNYGVFFEDELEILPNHELIFTGPIHSNKNIYLGKHLTINSELTSAGYIIKGREDANDAASIVKILDANGNYQFLTKNDDSLVPISNSFQNKDMGIPEMGNGTTGSGDPADTWAVDANWKKSALSRWNGRVMDKAMGVEYRTPPSVKELDPNTGYYAKTAGLKITTSVNNGVETIKMELRNESGILVFSKDITPSTNTEIVTVNSIGLPDISTSTIFSSTQFINEREFTDKMVKNTVINVDALQASPYWPANGLIYATRADAVADANPADAIPDPARVPNGFVLQNGKTLSKEMNFVTNNPVYVRGHFNQHKRIADGTSIPEYLDAAMTQPNPEYGALGVDSWQPVGIIADSLNLLSTNFDGTPRKAAADTEYNFAVIAGNVRTTQGLDNPSAPYSGGLENFARLTEDWTAGATLKFRGSLIQLWQSQYATGLFDNADYKQPRRDWGYDSSFSKDRGPSILAQSFPAVTKTVSITNWQAQQADKTSLFASVKGLFTTIKSAK